jgi:hypothetical protein
LVVAVQKDWVAVRLLLDQMEVILFFHLLHLLVVGLQEGLVRRALDLLEVLVPAVLVETIMLVVLEHLVKEMLEV